MTATLNRVEKVEVPQITSHWLRRWRKQYHVSLRRSNRRWKVSKSVCLERCRITWLNLYRARRLCALEHGYEPILHGWDQEPFHFNESGSQMNNALHWRGVPEVPLKESASATRARWTATTYTSTHPERFEEFPPLEVLFKGGATVEERLNGMLLQLSSRGDHGELTFFSAQVGPKGSYRTDHVVAFF